MKTHVVAIVQARMGSSRLPGKIMKPLAGKPALWHVIDRLRHAKRLEEIVIATTTETQDDVIVRFCVENGVPFFKGSEKDLLDRYYQAARMFIADPIVRITADCPVIDPTIVDEVVEMFLRDEFDVCGIAGEFPDGLDCTVFSFRALEDAWRHASLPSEREHVGPYLDKHPEKYRIGELKKFEGLGHLRWTLDEEADYRFLSEVFDRLYDPARIFLTEDILDLLEREPELKEINSGIVRNEGYLTSLEEDREYLARQRASGDE